tara:strand:+ start:774 stop:1121 length:348 start_codon:yes stop_codon:yes gene_type:complete
MKKLSIYYSLILTFYFVEIFLFKQLYILWIYDIFWLNAFLRASLSVFFSIIIKSLIFKENKYFYRKFFILALLNPIASSSTLVILMKLNLGIEVWLIKILGDIFISILGYLILKK